MDNFIQFFNAYRQYVRIITPKVMLQRLGEIEEDIIDASICWAVTDNMRALLELSPRDSIEETSNPLEIYSFLQKELLANALVIVLQDPNSIDHWFALIGDNGYVHIVEHLAEQCNSVETMELNSFLQYMSGIVVGLLPDRFYNSRSKHIFIMWSFNRRPLTEETVINFIGSS